MLISRYFLVFLLLVLANVVYGEDAHNWNGKRAAVVLTYDDSLNVHLDKVIPALNKRHLQGTFYITMNPPAFSTRMEDWRKAAKQGHELGNHTIFHPCAGNMAGREWVNPDYDLARYGPQRMFDEIALTNRILESVDGLKERTFAYTCGDTNAGKESFIPLIKPLFVGARGVANTFTDINNVDLFNINAFGVMNQTGDELIAQTRQALKDGTMIVYLFHGVGGEHNINVSEQAHTELLNYLQKQKDEIWVTTMINAAKFLRDH